MIVLIIDWYFRKFSTTRRRFLNIIEKKKKRKENFGKGS